MSEQKHAPEPFGYFKAEPFGWTDCAETDECAIPLYDIESIKSISKSRDSFKDAAAYNKRRAEDAERQRDELLKQVESIAFRIANKEYGHAALDCEEALAGAKGQVPDATKMIGAPATANYPHGSLGENVDSEGGAA